MIALKGPVCGNPVDEAIDGGCSKRCDDIFHGAEEMTPENQKALDAWRDIGHIEKYADGKIDIEEAGYWLQKHGYVVERLLQEAITAQAVTDDECKNCQILLGRARSAEKRIDDINDGIDACLAGSTRNHPRAGTRAPDAGLVKALEEAFSIADTEIQKPGDVDTRYRALKRTWLTLKEALAAHKAAARKEYQR